MDKTNNNEEAERPYSFITPKEQDLDEVTVPENIAIKEELEILLHMAEKYADDLNFDISLYVPISNTEINLFEQRTGIRLTDELREFYQFSNGLDASPGTMSLYCLENVEGLYKQGYCDWAEEGDTENYVLIGSDGGCDYLIMEKATGHIFWYGDEGEMRDIETIKDMLCLTIDFLYDNVRDFNEDDRINDYLDRNADRL
ncbi:MAG: SMI1/KNR4 family protein [Ruminococcus sp.]|nr:SMI1/KNR4 family protein [Ruminococcus sp.]